MILTTKVVAIVVEVSFQSKFPIPLAIIFSAIGLSMSTISIWLKENWVEDLLPLDSVGYISIDHNHVWLVSLLPDIPVASSPALVTGGCRVKVVLWNECGSSIGCLWVVEENKC